MHTLCNVIFHLSCQKVAFPQSLYLGWLDVLALANRVWYKHHCVHSEPKSQETLMLRLLFLEADCHGNESGLA